MAEGSPLRIPLGSVLGSTLENVDGTKLLVGATLGSYCMVGRCDDEGAKDGDIDGSKVGVNDGDTDGFCDGTFDGMIDGDLLGRELGDTVGAFDGSTG